MLCILCWSKYAVYAIGGVGAGAWWLVSKTPNVLPYLDSAYKFVFCNACGIVS